MSSSYFEGNCCPLAKIGCSRDGKRNTPQVNYGLLTTRAGCPVTISVYKGNTALKSSQICALVQGGELQLGLFDERHLFQFSHPDYPNERLMACRNVDLGKLRAHKRQALLEATEKELQKIRARIGNGSLVGRDQIGVRVGKNRDATFQMTTPPNPAQHRALQLLQAIAV